MLAARAAGPQLAQPLLLLSPHILHDVHKTHAERRGYVNVWGASQLLTLMTIQASAAQLPEPAQCLQRGQ
jgi:hypothetical protein